MHFSPLHVCYLPERFNLADQIPLKILQGIQPWSCWLYNFIHSPVTSSHLVPNVLLNTLFSTNPSPCSSQHTDSPRYSSAHHIPLSLSLTLTLFRTLDLLFGPASHKVDDLAGHKYPMVFKRSVSARLNNLRTVTEQTGAALLTDIALSHACLVNCCHSSEICDIVGFLGREQCSEEHAALVFTVRHGRCNLLLADNHKTDREYCTAHYGHTVHGFSRR